jgi:MYXO-CTERM domain-containing protein
MGTTTHNSPGFGTDYSYYYAFSFDAASRSSTEFMPIVRFSAVTPTPEPSSWLMGAAALAAVLTAARRRRPQR